MKILNVSSIIPLKGLPRQNDIILRIQDYLEEKYDFEFAVAKSLPFVPLLLTFISLKWKKYRQYQKAVKIDVQDYKTIIYPWLMPPTSNFWVNYLLIPFNWIWFKLLVEKKILQEAKEADLLLAQNLIPDAVIAFWLNKKYDKPYIINIRGKTNKHWYKLPLLRSIISSASRVITHSPTNFRLFKENYRIELIPHPVDDIFYANGDKSYEYPKLISICRLLSLKNLDIVIEALASIKQQGKKFEYRIVGDGPELYNLKQLVMEFNLSKEVFFEGYLSRERVAEQLREANIFIMPSNPETLGRAFLEAAASGCLVIGHKNTGIDGLFIDEESAILVNKDTVSEHLERLIGKFNRESALKYRAKSKNIVEKLQWSKIGQKYIDMYNSVVEYD